jgi:hypothetical protein
VVNTTGNDPYREVAVYVGGCESLIEYARGDYSTSFFGMAGETYWILVGSYALETSINTVLTVNDCRAPSNLATATSYIEEPDGIRVFYQVSVSGTPPFTYNWTFSDGTNFANAPSFISRFYGPFDPFPEGFSVTVANACGNSGTGGSLPPPCGAICLSLGVPNTRTGTNGSGSNSYSLPSSCGQFATGSSRWFLVSKLTNAAGIAFVSADGSAPDTMLGVFRGGIDPANLFPLTCSVSSNNRPARVEFETRPGSNYWLAVITTNPAALKLTYGYDVKFDTFTLNGPGGAMELRSAPLPSLQYQLVATTNLNANPPNWTVLMTTNFSGVGSASNNVLRFIETNVSNFTGRFYRITLIP